MKWHDLLYFSKGERQALTLLLSLIAMAWIAIIGTDFYRSQFQTVPLVNTGIKQDSSQIYSNKHLQIPFGKKKNPIRTKLKSLPKGNPNASEGNQSPIFPLIPKQKNGRKERLSN